MGFKEMSEKKKTVVICAVCAVVLAAGVMIGVLVSPMLKSSDKKEEKKEEEDTNQEIVMEKYDPEECVRLGTYKGRDVSLVPDEDDIQAEIDNLIEEYTTYEQKKGIAQEGDMVYVDFEGYYNGKKQDSATGSDYMSVEAGSEDWLPGFPEAVIGMQCGRTKEVRIDVPKGTYLDEEFDGKALDFKITLKYICGEEIVPDYNDEFVQSVTNYHTAKEHRKALKEKLAKENEEDKLQFVWSDIIEESEVKKCPETLLESARKEVLQGYYDMADLWGMSHDEVFQEFGYETEKDFKESYLTILANDTVLEILMAEAIAAKENISYTKEEYAELLKDEYENNSDAYDSKEDYEKTNKRYLENTALMNAVKNWLGENNHFITE